MSVIRHKIPTTGGRRPGGSRLALRLAAATALVWLVSPSARAAIVIDFENNPSLPTQPSTFAAAGAMQTYSQPGVFSITGGVVLGNPTFLAAFSAHGSPPNAYATADFGDPSLLDTITLTLPSAEGVLGVSGVFFNGQPSSETYTLTALSGATVVGTATPTLPAVSSTSDFFNFSFTSTAALPITSVTFTTPNAGTNGWDFFVDTIQITPSSPTVPEPASAVLLGLGGVAVAAAAWGRRRLRRAQAQ